MIKNQVRVTTIAVLLVLIAGWFVSESKNKAGASELTFANSEALANDESDTYINC